MTYSFTNKPNKLDFINKKINNMAKKQCFWCPTISDEKDMIKVEIETQRWFTKEYIFFCSRQCRENYRAFLKKKKLIN
jgi:hypothetical protein